VIDITGRLKFWIDALESSEAGYYECKDAYDEIFLMRRALESERKAYSAVAHELREANGVVEELEVEIGRLQGLVAALGVIPTDDMTGVKVHRISDSITYYPTDGPIREWLDRLPGCNK